MLSVADSYFGKVSVLRRFCLALAGKAVAILLGYRGGIMQERRIVCFGDSNTWGYDAHTGDRFGRDIRYTGVLQDILKDEYIIVEEGLCGRTSVFDDPLNDGLNGLKYLTPCLNTNSRLEWLTIMLGTNDCKERFGATPQNIADGVRRLIRAAKSLDVWVSKPQIIVIAPPPMEKGCETAVFAGEMGRCSDKSHKLAALYEVHARMEGCFYIDAGEFAQMNNIDYMHLDADSHKKLAKKIADILKLADNN